MTPQEYVARRILPLLRGLAASCHTRRGMSQHAVARLLGISQPMVHRYSRRRPEDYLAEIVGEGVPGWVSRLVYYRVCESRERLRGLSAEVANLLALYSRYCAENRGLCERILCPGRHAPLRLYREVLNRLVSHPGFYRLVPEVGSNLAYTPPGATSIDEVIGLDGRIVRARSGRVMVAGEPSLGGSRHTGAIALEHARLAGEAWAVALRYDERVLDALQGLEGVGVYVEEGGAGREPIIYVASHDPELLLEAIDKAASVIES